MEETSIPIRLSGFPAEVPLLPSVDYDFRGLDDFPTRHGIASDGLEELDHKSAEDSASLVQSWLFFGLLADLTGTLVDRQSVLHPDTDRPAPSLRVLVHSATSRHPELGLRVASRALSKRLLKSLPIAIDGVERIDRLNIAGKHPMPLVLLSVKILLCDLKAMQVDWLGIYSRPWVSRLEDFRLIPCPSSSRYVSSSAKALENLMIVKGWCPSHIHRIGSNYDYSMMHYLSTIDRRTSEKTTHEFCSSKLCQAYNSAPDSTSHKIAGCQCSFIAAPTEQLNEIIRLGGIPLISLHEAAHGKLAIHVHTSKAKSQYSAISHVWFGGLGNVQANSLPLCQLNYLNCCLSLLPKDGERGLNYMKNAFHRDLSGTVWISSLGLDNLISSKNRKPKLFWMDTLCIPVDPTASELRMKAINKMDAVYAHAREVLVLDSEVQTLSFSDTHPCELLSRLAYSSWMSRSWTLQEGAIGRATYFQCADGALTLERKRSYFVQQSLPSLLALGFRGVRSIIRHRATKIDYSEAARGRNMGHERLENHLLQVLLNSLNRGRNARTKAGTDMVGLVPEEKQLKSFVSIWNELRKRSTTKPEDMFAILANLLDFNAGQIIKLPRDERMKAILWSSSTIPFSLLYNTGPRLIGSKSPRDKWVPTAPKGSRLTESPSMKFAADGRTFRLTTEKNETQPLALIVQGDSLPPYSYLLDTKSEKMYFVKALRPVNDAVDAVPHQAICVVIEPFLGAERRDGDEPAPKVGPRSRGVCLSVTSIRPSSTMTPESPAQRPAQLWRALPSDKPFLSTIYDCPIRIWEVNDTESIPESEKVTFENSERPMTYPTARCKTLSTGYELHLETGIYSMITARQI